MTRHLTGLVHASNLHNILKLKSVISYNPTSSNWTVTQILLRVWLHLIKDDKHRLLVLLSVSSRHGTGMLIAAAFK